MIPKIIHYVWLGKKQMPSEQKAYIQGWRNLLPGWEFKEWNEENFDIDACAYAREAYRLKKYSFAADYVRVCVLEEYGGIYLDTDVELLRPFPEEMLAAECFIGFENSSHVEASVFGCAPRHPLFAALTAMYQKIPFVKEGKANTTPNPLYFTYFLRRDFGLKLKNKRQTLSDGTHTAEIYPQEYFSPIDFNTGKEHRTPATVCVHHFAYSWAGKNAKKRLSFERAVCNFFGKTLTDAFYKNFYTKRVLRRLNRMLRGERNGARQ